VFAAGRRCQITFIDKQSLLQEQDAWQQLMLKDILPQKEFTKGNAAKIISIFTLQYSIKKCGQKIITSFRNHSV